MSGVVGHSSSSWPLAKSSSIGSADRQAFVELLRAEAMVLPEARRPGVCRDPDDDLLLGCAAAGSVEYLVAGDADLLTIREYCGVALVGGRHFLNILSR